MKKISLGINNFKKLIEGNYYFIDKTLFIKDLINDGASVTLLPRPRRFGKTLNMSMLQYFFEKTDLSHRALFNGLKIEKDEEAMKHQGEYPVIFISLKEAKKPTWAETWTMIKEVIISEYKRHQYLLESGSLDQREKDNFSAILNDTASQHVFECSLKNLSTYLHRYHKKCPFILIDEYDSPIHAGFTHDFYDQVMNFMRSFLGAALKDNNDLFKGVMTGILRIAKESIFSGLNNLKICTLVDKPYADVYGFLEDDVKALLRYFNCKKEYQEVKEWYNGYQVGEHQTVYNPWSILNYIGNQETFKPYWIRTGENSLIKMIIKRSPAQLKRDIEILLSGKPIEKRVNDLITFPDFFTSADAACNFLLFTGYLSFTKLYLNDENEPSASMVIPNIEIRSFYKDVVLAWFNEGLRLEEYQEMLEYLTEGKIDLFKKLFAIAVTESMSYFDTTGKEPENFYHSFVLGMLICLNKTHQVVSNRESGLGRYDLMLIPKNLTKPGIIIEFKKSIDESDEELNFASNQALAQIKDKKYATELEARGITKIISLGIALRGKKVMFKEAE
jgi:hypothetical protein